MELLLAFGTLIFMVVNRKRLSAMPDYGLLRVSFYAVLLALVATVAETVALGDLLNLDEHAFYALATLGLCAWGLRRIRKGDLCNPSS